MSDSNELKVVINSQIDGLKAGLKEASATVQSAISDIKTAFANGQEAAEKGIGGIISSLGTLGPAVAGAAAAFAVFEGIKGAVEAFKEFGHEVEHLSNILGISSEAASGLSGTLKVLGMGSDEYLSVMMKMERQMKKSPEDFDRLGIAVKNADGTFREQPAILDSVIEKLKEYKPGVDQVMFAMDAMGPRGAQAAFQLLHMKEAAEIATPIMKGLGLEMGENAVEAARNLEMRSNALGLVLTGLKVKIGEELINAIQPTDTGLKQLTKVAEIAIDVFKALAAAALIVKEGFIIVLDVIKIMFQPLTELTKGLVAALGALMSAAKGDFSTAWTQLKAGGVNAFNAIKDAGKDMYSSIKDTASSIQALWAKATPSAGGEAKGTRTYTPKPEAGTAAKSRLPEWELELAELRKQEEEKGVIEGTYHQFSKSEELKFWQDKLSQIRMSQEEEQSVKQKMYQNEDAQRKTAYNAYLDGLRRQTEEARKGSDARISAAKKEWDAVVAAGEAGTRKEIDAQHRYREEIKIQNAELLKLQETAVEAKAEWALEDLKTKEEQLKTELELNKGLAEKEIDLFGSVAKAKAGFEAQYIAGKKNLVNQELEIEKEKINALIQLRKQDPNADPVTLEKLNNQLITVTKKKDKELKKLDTEMAKNQLTTWAEVKKTFTGLFDPLVNSFSSAVTGMIMGTQTLQQAISSMAQNILNTFINMAVKMATTWIANLIAESLTTQEVKGAEADSVITANAAEAASGAAAAEASIPYVGPALAVAAAAAMLALVLGYKSMAHASGGYDIPCGINPIVQAHGGEMILPAHLAEGVRNMTDSSGKGNFIFAPNITAMDSKSFVQTLKSNKSDLTRFFRAALRDYRMG